MKKAGSVQKAAESLWEVREERGLMNLTGVGKPEFDEILHPAIIFFISERFGSMGCPQGMLAPVTESRPNYTQTFFLQSRRFNAKMSIYWEKHGSHVVSKLLVQAFISSAVWKKNKNCTMQCPSKARKKQWKATH